MQQFEKYIPLWSSYSSLIKDKLLMSVTLQQIQLKYSDFQKVGNRKLYSFNLEINKGCVVNNIRGSAVARDLFKVLNNSLGTKEILRSGYFKINMSKDFCLYIKKM